MSNAGSALMGIGSARGEDRARAAAEMAVSSPLLEASIDGAHGVLLSIAGGSDLGLFEVSAAADLIQNAAHEDANIIFGTVIDDALGDEVRVTVIAAGFEGGQPPRRQPGISRASDLRTLRDRRRPAGYGSSEPERSTGSQSRRPEQPADDSSVQPGARRPPCARRLRPRTTTTSTYRTSSSRRLPRVDTRTSVTVSPPRYVVEQRRGRRCAGGRRI